jgi:RND family efflux transporter MFP subunit
MRVPAGSWRAFGTAGLLAAALLAPGLPAAAQEAGMPGAGAPDTVPQIVPVVERELPRAVTAYGVVHAHQESVLSAKVLARIVSLPLREGAAVKAGDLLVALDHKDIDAGLAAAEAARVRAEASMKEAEAEHARVARLFDSGSATSREMERAESALQAARGGLNEAEARVQEARAQKGYTRILAPFDGRLVERKVEVGELASPGTPLVRVESAGNFELWADVPQERLSAVRPGAEATVRVDGIAAPIPGRVLRVVPAADPRSHTFTVKVALDSGAGGGDGAVYSGMFGQAAVVYGSEPALVVPHGAIVHRSEVTGVYVANADGAPEFRLVRPGRRVGDDQVVESGLSAGERVYADGAAAARVRAAGAAGTAP